MSSHRPAVQGVSVMQQAATQEEKIDLAGMVADLNSLLRLKTTAIGMKMFARAEDMAAIPTISCGAVQAAVSWGRALCRLRAWPRSLPLVCCWLDLSFLRSCPMTATTSTCRARRLGQCYILRLDISCR